MTTSASPVENHVLQVRTHMSNWRLGIVADQPCDHTHQRRYVYGGALGDQFHCPCGRIFTPADFDPLGSGSLNPAREATIRR